MAKIVQVLETFHTEESHGHTDLELSTNMVHGFGTNVKFSEVRTIRYVRLT